LTDTSALLARGAGRSAFRKGQVDQPLGDEGGILEAVVQGHPLEPAEALVGNELVELELEAGLAAERPERVLALEPDADVLHHLVLVAQRAGA
jgi:hypothetical protein